MRWRKFRREPEQSGQGMVEYILIVALVAIAAVVALRAFGVKLADWFNRSAASIDQNIPSGH